MASVWPGPRWVLVIKSDVRRLSQTPAAVASCPMDRCAAPVMSPSLAARSAASSKARIRHIVANSARTRWAETVGPPVSGGDDVDMATR